MCASIFSIYHPVSSNVAIENLPCLDDCPTKISIYRKLSVATFDYERVNVDFPSKVDGIFIIKDAGNGWKSGASGSIKHAGNGSKWWNLMSFRITKCLGSQSSKAEVQSPFKARWFPYNFSTSQRIPPPIRNLSNFGVGLQVEGQVVRHHRAIGLMPLVRQWWIPFQQLPLSPPTTKTMVECIGYYSGGGKKPWNKMELPFQTQSSMKSWCQLAKSGSHEESFLSPIHHL